MIYRVWSSTNCAVIQWVCRFFSDVEVSTKTSSCQCYMAKLSCNVPSEPGGDVQHVLDGEALLHRIPWPRGVGNLSGYLWIILQLCDQEYGNAIVVFVGYDISKNMTRQRRAAGKSGLAENMKITLKKDNFLANPKNKQRVINTLSHFLQENNCPAIMLKATLMY